MSKISIIRPIHHRQAYMEVHLTEERQVQALVLLIEIHHTQVQVH
jgi:hypothetical protein